MRSIRAFRACGTAKASGGSSRSDNVERSPGPPQRAAASLAEQIVEAGHDAVAAQPDSVTLRRHRRRPVDVGAAAEIGVHELEPERKLAREFEFDAAAHRPAGMHGGALRDHAERVVAKAGLDSSGGEAAFNIGQPSIKAVADAAGYRPELRELRGPYIRRGEVGTGKAAIEVGGRG